MLNRIAEDPTATILCVGAIAEEKQSLLERYPAMKAEYRSRIDKCLAELTSKGYRNILFCNWAYFDRMVAECIREMNGDERLFPMAVFPDCEYGIEKPNPENFFEFIIYRSKEHIALDDESTTEALLNMYTTLKLTPLSGAN